MHCRRHPRTDWSRHAGDDLERHSLLGAHAGSQSRLAAAAIATIALGVGVNAGIFTTVNGLLYRDLPAGDAHELVTIQQAIEGLPDRGQRPGAAGSRRRSTER